MKKILLTAAAASILISSPTLAIESDFFVKANAGWSRFTKVKGAKSKNDIFLGLGAGYNYMDNVRLDLTFDHFLDPKFKNGNVRVKGEINTLLLNGYIDLFDISVAKIFVGAGVGFSKVKAKVSGHVIPVGQPNAGQADDTKNGTAKKKYNVAYAAYLGSSVEVAPGVTGEITYSYRVMGETKRINGTSYDFKGHNLGAGVRFDI